MKINGVTVFQETLTMNSSLCSPTGRKTFTHTHKHHECVIRRLRTELKSLRHWSSATEYNKRPHTKKVANKMRQQKRQFSAPHKVRQRDDDEDDFIAFTRRLPSLLHFLRCIRPLPCHLLNSNPLLCVVYSCECGAFGAVDKTIN